MGKEDNTYGAVDLVNKLNGSKGINLTYKGLSSIWQKAFLAESFWDALTSELAKVTNKNGINITRDGGRWAIIDLGPNGRGSNGFKINCTNYIQNGFTTIQEWEEALKNSLDITVIPENIKGMTIKQLCNALDTSRNK